MAATLDKTPSGKWRVWRDFDSLPAATAAIARLAEVTEAAFLPPKPIIASVPRVPHDVAQAAMRDGAIPPRDPEQDDDEGTPADFTQCRVAGGCE